MKEFDKSSVRHSITSVDSIKMTGICAVDGPVSVILKTTRGRDYYICRIAKKLSYRNDNKKQRMYQLTQEQYDAMSLAQGNVCAICKEPETVPGPNGKLRALAVDHDHSCCPGKVSCGACVRQLLCMNCNTFVGKLEKPGYLPEVLKYLAQHNTPDNGVSAKTLPVTDKESGVIN